MSKNIFEFFSDSDTVHFAYGEYFSSDESPDVSLIHLLSLDTDKLKPFTKAVLDESEYPQDFKETMKEIRFGIHAYSQFQDILDIAISFDNPNDSMLNRHYCYYESLVYLRESVVAWLEENILAGLVLLRPFLELAVFHLYWYLRCKDGDYEPFYKWLTNEKGKPPFKNQFEYVFSHLPTLNWLDEKRINLTKTTLENIYRTCCAYNHTPKVDESILSLGSGRGQISALGFFYYLSFANILLRQVVHLYVLAYPMSLFPVERHKKWAVSGPVGLFFDKNNFAILAAYLGKETVSGLRKKLVLMPEIKSLLEWYEQHPDLSAEEINTDWERFKKENNIQQDAEHIGQMIASGKSHSRALGWALNYLQVPKNVDDISDEMLTKMRQLLRVWK